MWQEDLFSTQNDPGCDLRYACDTRGRLTSVQGGDALILCPISRVNSCLRQSKCTSEILSQYHSRKTPGLGRSVGCRGIFSELLYIAFSLWRTLLTQSNRMTRKPESDVILIWMALKSGSPEPCGQEAALFSTTESNFTGKGRSPDPVFPSDELCWIIQCQECIISVWVTGERRDRRALLGWACILEKLKVSAWSSPKASSGHQFIRALSGFDLWVTGWSTCLLEVWKCPGSVLKLICNWIRALENHHHVCSNVGN